MPAVFAALAGLAVLVHFAFAIFVLLGAWLAWRWRWMPWAHLPAAAWGTYVEFSGRLCPLTPLENALRVRAGLDRYEEDFIGRYVLPVLYPEGLTRHAQLLMGTAVVVVNMAAYGWLVWDRRRRARR